MEGESGVERKEEGREEENETEAWLVKKIGEERGRQSEVCVCVCVGFGRGSERCGNKIRYDDVGKVEQGVAQGVR